MVPEARVHCTTTTGATATLSAANLNASSHKSLEVVQKLDGSGADDGFHPNWRRYI